MQYFKHDFFLYKSLSFVLLVFINLFYQPPKHFQRTKNFEVNSTVISDIHYSTAIFNALDLLLRAMTWLSGLYAIVVYGRWMLKFLYTSLDFSDVSIRH